jgi:glutathione synthase/RimK-type ligase-like ATP-grasp enzyme
MTARSRPRTIGLVTCDALPDLTPDDRLAADALAARGHDVRPVVWTDTSIDRTAFDALVLRSCWDYHRQPDAFRGWLAAIDAEGVPLHNSAAQAGWNMDKRYLRDLGQRGVSIVPTMWLEPHDPRALAEVRRATGWTDLIVKPAVSATAWRLHRVSAERDDWPEDLAATLTTDVYLVQPFVAAIAEGEWSMVFFDGCFSHAVLKRPRADDFRVQEEYGGRAEVSTPPRRLVEQAQHILDVLPERPLYARVDGVGTEAGFLLLELELLEPVLFFAADAGAVDRFADALEARVRTTSERSSATD